MKRELIDILIPRNIMIYVDIGGHPPVPIGSSCQFLVQHVLMYFFVMVGPTLLGLSKAPHIF
jgi:hypothetical protein